VLVEEQNIVSELEKLLEELLEELIIKRKKVVKVVPIVAKDQQPTTQQPASGDGAQKPATHQSHNNNCENTLAFQVLDADTESAASSTLENVLQAHGLDYAQVKEIMNTQQLSDSQVLETLSKLGTATTLAIQGEEVVNQFD